MSAACCALAWRTAHVRAEADRIAREALQTAIEQCLGAGADPDALGGRLTVSGVNGLSFYRLDGLPLLRVSRRPDELVVDHLAADGRVEASRTYYFPKGRPTDRLRPCRSPYCECEAGRCTHPGCFDARHL